MTSTDAPLTVSEVRTKFPELNAETYPDGSVSAAIATARAIAASTREIWLHETAHLLVLSRLPQVDGGAGEITDATLGPQQNKYKSMADKGREVFHTTTVYGRIVLMLEERSINSRFSVAFA